MKHVTMHRPTHAARRARNRLRQRAGADDGFTFIEFLVAAGMMLIVAVAVMALMLVSFRQDDNQADRVTAIDEARNALLKMTTEVRGAAGLDSVSPQVLDVLVHVPEDAANPYHWIRYKCVGNDQGSSQGLGGTCTRQDKTIHNGPDCSTTGSGPGCTVFLRRVIKNKTPHFAEPCKNNDPVNNEERQFCLKDNRTVQFSVWVQVDGAENPIELRGAATVRNCMNKQEVVIPCVEAT
mgnify:CR=1 FL=1